jgi:hypothetical protein
MNASEVMNELRKYGAVADKEWHGEKLEMKTHDQRAEEWAASEYNQEADEQQGEEKIDFADAGRFEVEFEDTKPKRQTSFDGKGSNGLDALQRQRSSPSTVY